ncbi:unnamed protein product [Lupinus luteus]|uniref:BHLH domain-containing protein n=1 Tax=Lupinus luteus TaxID=3873 RepID=A0AAV1X085_LUPLU
MITLGCGSPKNEKMKKNLSTQLAVAVRSIQWSYGIFWACSTTQQGLLEWKDGYYNGDIKTRKTVQSMIENKGEQIGLQRSEQLRELYKFLLVGEADPQTKRPSDALSLEDLSDSEWYYLVCMSFVFNPNRSLPGRALELGDTIWLCNAQHADNKGFSCSLLAKTVVCFPYLEGIIEIGTTELEQEDPNLIHHVKACFLEFSKPICSDKLSTALNKPEDDDEYQTYIKYGHEILDTVVAKEVQEEKNEYSPNGFSNGCENQFRLQKSIIEGINDGSSQVQLIDYDLSNDSLDSLSSYDCMQEASENQNVSQIQLRELESNASDEELYYTRTLCAVLGNSATLRHNPSNSNCKSSFVKWKKGVNSERKGPRLEQSMLKKTLFVVPFMDRSCSYLKSQKENVFSYKNRETTNFQVLKSVVPSSSISKVDKISILGEIIKYLKKLETRVKELESYMDIADSAARSRRNCQDVLEQISDNYGARKIYKGMKPLKNKRKACDVDAHTVESSTVDGVLKLALKTKFRGAATAPSGMIKEALWKVSRNS